MKPTETHYEILKLIEEDGDIKSQRALAKKLGISLGKANYCLRAIVDKGWVKANNFKKSDDKKAYVYLLTSHGIKEKARLTLAFLQCKQDEYLLLKEELEELELEAVRAQLLLGKNSRGEQGLK